MKRLNKLTFCSLLLLLTQITFHPFVIANTLDRQADSYFKKNQGEANLLANIDDLRALLLSDRDFIIVELPIPSGELVKFKLTPEQIMADELAKKYPNIKTFSGVAIDSANVENVTFDDDSNKNTGRFDITPNGFHGMFYYQGERVFVEPEIVYIGEESVLKASKTDSSKVTTLKRRRVFNEVTNAYKSYVQSESRLESIQPYEFHQPKKITSQLDFAVESQSNDVNKAAKTLESTSTIKTYRIAISAAAEYTEFNGGTVDSAMAEIVTLVNRLNQVYQHDLAIKLELVENSDLLIFTDANADPFNNDSDDGDLNTSVINGIIGSAGYDIGHVVNTDGGGLAVLGGVCNSIYKGDGVTGDPNPTNDAFYIDYVAHEIGHQFGAEHTFNGTSGACEGNRESDSAYEVGSGSTIMAYAGICGDQNLQTHSDAFFHARSIEQIRDNIENGFGRTCGITTGDVNNTAAVDAGADFTIPAKTPFKLTGNAQDSDNDTLTYSWQQFDLGTASASLAEQVDDGSRPLFRAFLPSDNASRYFPQLSDVLNGETTKGESLPTTNRELNFRLMVFDQQGGVSFDEAKLTVVDTGQAFSLNTPLSDDVWTASSNTISWEVADTDIAPISCASVDVLLSTDNGETFDISLATNIANNGAADVEIGSFCADTINSTQARVKLVCSDNIFFAINNGAFSISKALNVSDISIIEQPVLSLVQGDSITLNTAQFTYKCQPADTFTIQAGDNYTVSDQTITPSSDFVGELQVAVVANKETVSSGTFVVTITVEAKPDPVVVPQPETSSSSSSGSFYWLLLSFCIMPLRILLLKKVSFK